jgi:hypothetical protein
MASAKSRPTIPWNEAAPAFHVKDNDPDFKKTTRHFSKSNVYYLGSDNGCGCGFPRDTNWMTDDKEELASQEANKRLLMAYLEGCLVDEESLELFSCWSGDEEEKLESIREIRIEDMAKNEFFFAERQLTKVSRNGK